MRKKETLRNPMAMSEVLHNPMESPTALFDTSVARELQKLTGILFSNSRMPQTKNERRDWIKDATYFADSAATILTFIDGCKISKNRKEYLIAAFGLACLCCSTKEATTYGSIERLRAEIKNTRMLRARKSKADKNKIIDNLVRHHANRRWQQNPKRRKSDNATAREIEALVNEDLKASGLKIGKEAIRKRIRIFK
jgi:hypothetical protein